MNLIYQKTIQTKPKYDEDTIVDLLKKDKEIALLEQQVEFFKTELKRLQVELALVSAKNKGLFGRLRSLFGGQRELPRSEGLT